MNTELIDNIIKININQNIANIGVLNTNAFSFILINETVRFQIAPNEWKTLPEYKVIEDAQSIRDELKLSINSHTLNIARTFDVTKIEVQNNVNLTTILRRTISTYFREGGSNLHLINYDINMESLDPRFDYLTGINLVNVDNNFDFQSTINSFIEKNVDKKIFWISTPLGDGIEFRLNTQNVFFLEIETGQVHWIAQPAAYLNQLSLSGQVRDWTYTVAKSFLPSIHQKITLTQNQEWVKNYFANIGSQATALGGEMYNKQNLVNAYMLVLLEKRLKLVLLEVLKSKPRSSEIVGKLQNVLSTELNNFYTINAIESTIYQGIDYKINYNGTEYTVLSQGELLERGYKVHIVDVLNRTTTDLEQRKMTPVTLVISPLKQIRFIELNMEVL